MVFRTKTLTHRYSWGPPSRRARRARLETLATRTRAYARTVKSRSFRATERPANERRGLAIASPSRRSIARPIRTRKPRTSSREEPTAVIRLVSGTAEADPPGAEAANIPRVARGLAVCVRCATNAARHAVVVCARRRATRARSVTPKKGTGGIFFLFFARKGEGKSEKRPIASSLPITYPYRPSCAIVRFGTRGLRRHIFIFPRLTHCRSAHR